MLRILSIDSDENDSEIIRHLLKKADIELDYDVCRNLKAAMEFIDQAPPDIIFLEVHLHDSFGEETFHRIRKRFPLIPIIIISGATSQEAAYRLLKDGADDYIDKVELNMERNSLYRKTMAVLFKAALRKREQ